MKRLHAILRVMGLALFLGGIATVVTLRQAQAHFEEVLGGFGQQLASLGEFSPHSNPRTLFVNGAAIRIETLSTPLGIPEALDRFGGLCHSVNDIEVSLELRRNLESSAPRTPMDSAGMVRQESETEGYLGCLDVGSASTPEGLVDKLLELGRTKNLNSLGQLRYAMARRHGPTTTLVVLWTEGDLKLDELFPKNRDAPGRELVDVPRPEHSRRLLSAFEEKLPYGFVAYHVEARPAHAVRASYEALLADRSWNISSRKGQLFVAEKDGRKLLVQVRKRRPSGVIVTISDLG